MVIHRKPFDHGQASRGILYQRGLMKNSNRTKNIETVIITPRPDPVTFSAILGYLEQIKNLKKIVYLSTFGVYEESSKKINETAEIFPVSVYQKNKYYEEIVLGQFVKRIGIKLCIARLSSVYGDVQNKEVVNVMVRQLLYKSDMVINGDGNQTRDYIFIEDAAELISFLALRDQKSRYEVFNICSGKGYSINEISSILEKISGKKLIFRHAPPSCDERINSVGDNTKIIKASGYKIRYPIVDGLRKTLENYYKNI